MIVATHGILANASSSLNFGLLAYYQAESTANDSLGAYNGTAQGLLTYSAGKNGNAFTGNGTNAFVQITNNSFNFASDFSISCWFSISRADVNQEIFSNADLVSSVDKGYRLSFRGVTNFIRFSVYGTSIVNLDTPTSALSLNTWYMITATRKASTGSKIYINGTLSTSNNSTVNPSYTSGTFAPCVGAYKSTTTPSTINYLANNTKVDEMAIWNRELTATEITQLYNSGSGKFYPY